MTSLFTTPRGTSTLGDRHSWDELSHLHTENKMCFFSLLFNAIISILDYKKYASPRECLTRLTVETVTPTVLGSLRRHSLHGLSSFSLTQSR